MIKRCHLLRLVLNTLECDEHLKYGFKKTIEPILLDLRRANLEELVYRLAYTIVDQRRDVEDVVIPIWFTFRLCGISLEEIRDLGEGFLEEVFACLLREYGHEGHLPQNDLNEISEELGRGKQTSRAMAVAEALFNLSIFEKISAKLVGRKLDLKSFIEKYYGHLMTDKVLRARFIRSFKLLGSKSLEFFLRDIIPNYNDIELIPMPVDVHVAATSQLLGLYFYEEELEEICRGRLDRAFNVSYRAIFTKEVAGRLKELAKRCGLNSDQALKTSRALFLLGAYYCSERKCHDCPVKKECFYQLLLKADFRLASKFRERIGS